MNRGLWIDGVLAWRCDNYCTHREHDRSIGSAEVNGVPFPSRSIVVLQYQTDRWYVALERYGGYGGWDWEALDGVPPEAQGEDLTELARVQVVQWRKRWRKRSAHARLARMRASHLLRSELTPEQNAQLKTHRFFEVIGQTGSPYRIVTNGALWRYEGNTDGRDFWRFFCVAPYGDLPIGDRMLALLLNVTAAEPELLQVANAGALEQLPRTWLEDQ